VGILLKYALAAKRRGLTQDGDHARSSLNRSGIFSYCRKSVLHFARILLIQKDCRDFFFHNNNNPCAKKYQE